MVRIRFPPAVSHANHRFLSVLLDSADHHVTGAPMRPASVGHCTKNLLEIKTAPSSVPA